MEASNVKRAHPEGVLCIDHVFRVERLVHVPFRVLIQELLDPLKIPRTPKRDSREKLLGSTHLFEGAFENQVGVLIDDISWILIIFDLLIRETSYLRGYVRL